MQACIEVAEAISAEAQRNTPVGATGRARDSHRVVVDKSQNPPLVAAVAGGGDAFYYRYRFLEFGSAFRPR